MKLADVAIAATLPLGIGLTALALFSGSVWGRPTWGSWWEWDGRTVSTLVLLFCIWEFTHCVRRLPILTCAPEQLRW
ncbi:MAG: hypothetical protein CM15mP120_25530 [Pseudomonadota bacterium]|nr:MAG: hypothetical protein CM15mP120_25530 [Pseudomonadota bacterium]